jgi:hypothetical protein
MSHYFDGDACAYTKGKTRIHGMTVDDDLIGRIEFDVHTLRPTDIHRVCDDTVSNKVRDLVVVTARRVLAWPIDSDDGTKRKLLR